MKNKLLTTVILSVLAVSLVLSTGIYALVADEEVEIPEASASNVTVSPETAPETVDENDENNYSPVNSSEDYAFTEEYLDDLYWYYGSELDSFINFYDYDGEGTLDLGIIGSGSSLNGWVSASYAVHIPEFYGRPGEDRPLEVYDSNKENPEDPYDKYVQIPYDELDSDLKRAVTARYRKYQEILDGGRMVPLDENPNSPIYAYVGGRLDSDFYPSAEEAVNCHDDVFRGKVVGITFEVDEYVDIGGTWTFVRDELYTVYEVEVVDPLKGNVDEHVKIRVCGGHPTYGIAEQRKALIEGGLDKYYTSQCAPERVLELNETYIFTIDVTYGISIIPTIDWSQRIIDPDKGLEYWDIHCIPFAFKASEPSGNGTMATGNPNGEANYENILAYINSKSNEVDK